LLTTKAPAASLTAFLASSLTLISSIAIAAATVVIEQFDNRHDPAVDYTIVNTGWTALTLLSAVHVYQFTLADWPRNPRRELVLVSDSNQSLSAAWHR